jgi:AraC-like DNA-binding protein/quercetin dioxygenase-like cupin family protein
MRAHYEDITSKKGNASFVAYAFSVPAFEFKWHYHPEYELTLITHGRGKRLVGDSYENFESGDLVLLGPGLPHTWSSNETGKQDASAVVIQFSEDFVSNFLSLPEFKRVGDLLASASGGLVFNHEHLHGELEQLPTLAGVEKITSLFNILQKLSTQKGIRLSSEYFSAVKGEENENRINKVCQYIQKNASQAITLEHTAALIHLSPSAFCKFFKRATGKTFSDYVNDIRVGNACQLLTESDKAVGDIAYETGFESLTYFNRVFLKKKKVTPRNFRNSVVGAEE